MHILFIIKLTHEAGEVEMESAHAMVVEKMLYDVDHFDDAR